MRGGFPRGSVVKNPPARAGDMGLIWEDPTCQGAAKFMCPTVEPVL